MPGLTIDNPVTLDIALGGINVIPGDVLALRGGVYTADYINRVVGSSGSYVTVQPYGGERVIIKGDFSELSSPTQYVTFVDIEFDAICPARTIAESAPVDYPYHDFHGTGNRLINCTLHDSAGAGFWDMCDLFYGCITYNHGVKINGGSDGAGHSLYCQNDSNPNRKTIKHSIFGRSANYGLHGYATGFPLQRFDVIECVLLPGSSHLIGSQKEDDDIVFNRNHSYGTTQLGYGAHDHTNLTLQDNLMFNPTDRPIQYHRWASGNIGGNTFITGMNTGTPTDVLVIAHSVGTSSLVMDNNAYYNRSQKTLCFNDDPIGWKTLAQWQSAYGFDLNSTITLDGSNPVNTTHVYPNEYAAVSKRKGLVVIHNWTEAATVDVDLSTIAIDVGRQFNVLNGQNPLVDVVTVTMPQDKVVTFAMTGHTIAGVTGWADPPSTFPAFGAFVLEI